MPTNPNKPTRQEKLQHLHAALAYVPKRRFNVAIDVGAHVGLWTEILVSRFKEVWAFEPLEANFERLVHRMNDPEVLAARVAENVCLYSHAVGAESRQVTMRGEAHSKHFAVPDAAGTVQMVTLDDFGPSAIDFLKVDCEGGDYHVLKGGERLIRQSKPVIIVESLPRFEARYGLEPEAPLRLLESWGMKLVETHWQDFIYAWPK